MRSCLRPGCSVLVERNDMICTPHRRALPGYVRHRVLHAIVACWNHRLNAPDIRRNALTLCRTEWAKEDAAQAA